MIGLTHDQIIQMGFDENNLPSGYYRSDIGGGGGGSSVSSPQIPQSPFTNEWFANNRKQAFDTLTPYYAQKLKDANGDVELAKKYIEDDYKLGVRYRTEDLALEQGNTDRAAKRLAEQYNLASEGFQKGEAYRAEERGGQLASENLTAEQETRESVAKANQRGTYVAEIPQGRETAEAPVSNYYTQYIGQPLSQTQSLRKQAIERAIKRQSEVAGLELKGEEQKKTYGTEEAKAGLEKRTLASTYQGDQEKALKERNLAQQNIAFRDEQDRLKREQEQRAYREIAPEKYNEEYAVWRGVNKLG